MNWLVAGVLTQILFDLWVVWALLFHRHPVYRRRW